MEHYPEDSAAHTGSLDMVHDCIDDLIEISGCDRSWGLALKKNLILEVYPYEYHVNSKASRDKIILSVRDICNAVYPCISEETLHYFDFNLWLEPGGLVTAEQLMGSELLGKMFAYHYSAGYNDSPERFASKKTDIEKRLSNAYDIIYCRMADLVLSLYHLPDNEKGAHVNDFIGWFREHEWSGYREDSLGDPGEFQMRLVKILPFLPKGDKGIEERRLFYESGIFAYQMLLLEKSDDDIHSVQGIADLMNDEGLICKEMIKDFIYTPLESRIKKAKEHI